jgi:hypothetical protein
MKAKRNEGNSKTTPPTRMNLIPQLKRRILRIVISLFTESCTVRS